MAKRAKTTIVISISAIFAGMIAPLVFVLVNLSAPYSYSGEYKDLYSTAVWNIFGVRGYYSGGEYYRDPSIEIYEKDSKGRVMFAYCEGQAFDSDELQYLGGIVIMQSSDDDGVLSYDNCYLPIYDGKVNDFRAAYSEDAINQFKMENDWDLEINENLCLRHPYVNGRPNGELNIKEKEFESVIKTYVHNHGYKGDDAIYRYSYFSQNDKNGKELYYVSGWGRDVEGQGVSPDSVSKRYRFAIIFNEDKSCPDTNIVEITDIKESFNVVKELKTAANWNI